MNATGPLSATPLCDDTLDDAIAFLRSANPFAQHTWGWDTGRFIDFRWGGNALRDQAEPGFFQRHARLVHRGDDVVALVLAEVGADDLLHPDQNPRPAGTGVGFGGAPGAAPRPAHRALPSDEASWVHQVIERHGFTRGEPAGLEWGYDLEDVPEPFEPEGFVIDFVRSPQDYSPPSRFNVCDHHASSTVAGITVRV